MNTNHLGEAVRLLEQSKARLEASVDQELAPGTRVAAREQAAVLVAQAQVHATLVLAERTHG